MFYSVDSQDLGDATLPTVQLSEQQEVAEMAVWLIVSVSGHQRCGCLKAERAAGHHISGQEVAVTAIASWYPDS